MVRLRVDELGGSTLGSVAFQFLHGAIKGFFPAISKRLNPLFQFLHGAIKGENPLHNISIIGVFQFLHGSPVRAKKKPGFPGC